MSRKPIKKTRAAAAKSVKKTAGKSGKRSRSVKTSKVGEANLDSVEARAKARAARRNKKGLLRFFLYDKPPAAGKPKQSQKAARPATPKTKSAKNQAAPRMTATRRNTNDSESMGFPRRGFVYAAAKITALFGGKKKQDYDVVYRAVTNGKKRVGKNMRRILMYGGIGLLAAAVVLVIVLVPRQDDASGDAQLLAEMADISIPLTDAPASTPTPTTTVTPTTVPTTTPAPSPSPTAAPTPTPTVVPTTTPAPSPSPTPTPTPTPPPPVSMSELVDFYRVEADLYYNQVGYSTNYYEYTDEEMHILAQVIHKEARGETLEGMIAVGNVVMNRVLNSVKFTPNTITAVVVESGQFAYNPDTNPSTACRTAARMVLDDQKWVVAQHVYFFKTSDHPWGTKTLYKKIDHHYFFSYPYPGRNNNGNVPPELFERTFEWPRYGCKPGTRVRRVQAMLHSLGYDVLADGWFGMGTKEALEAFQSENGLTTDGVAGPVTIEKLIRAYGVEKYQADFE